MQGKVVTSSRYHTWCKQYDSGMEGDCLLEARPAAPSRSGKDMQAPRGAKQTVPLSLMGANVPPPLASYRNIIAIAVAVPPVSIRSRCANQVSSLPHNDGKKEARRGDGDVNSSLGGPKYNIF